MIANEILKKIKNTHKMAYSSDEPLMLLHRSYTKIWFDR